MRGIYDMSEASEAHGGKNQRLAALVESSPLGIICLDLRANVTMWNPAAERVFGWKSHEALGRPLPNIPEEKAEEYWAMLPDVLAGAEITEFEALCRTKGGAEITVSISVAPIRDGRGDVEGCMGMIVDITERKRSERELEETNQRLTQIFDQSVDTLLIHDENGNIADCNAEACRSLGYSREEILAMNVRDLATPIPKAKGKPSGDNPLWRDLVSGRRERVGFGFAEHHRRDGGRDLPGRGEGRGGRIRGAEDDPRLGPRRHGERGGRRGDGPPQPTKPDGPRLPWRGDIRR